METYNSAWVRAVLPMCLLGVFERGESYGYALIQRLAAAGLDPVKPATLYPALTRLAEEGAVEIEWHAGDGGPGRKYYRITRLGRERLAAERLAWRGFDTAVTRLSGADAGAAGESARCDPRDETSDEGEEG